MADIKDAPDGLLRAWADSGVISSARYVEEMDRRAGRATVAAPPLDYALDGELEIPDIDLDLSDFDDAIGPMPPPPAVKWVALITASLIILTLWMVL